MKRLIAFLGILTLFISCKEKNQALEFYIWLNDGSQRKPEFSIKEIANSNYVYQTNTTLFLNDSIYGEKVILRFSDNKFIAKCIEPETNEFVVFNLDAEINKNLPIVLKYNNTHRSFESRLERIVYLNKNFEVYIYLIKNWGKTPFFGDKFFDVRLFVTKKYGVIGSYFTMVSEGKNIMFGSTGNILKNYIDYSAIENVTLK